MGVVLAAAILMLVALIPSGAAASTLTVHGAVFASEISPGQKVTHAITVSLGPSDSPRDVTIGVYPVAQDLSGSYRLLEPFQNNAFSAAQYITLDRISAHLEPGISQVVLATVAVPSDVGVGGRYAVINIQTSAGGQGSVGVASAINVPVQLTIRNSALVHNAEITHLALGEPHSGEPLALLTTVRNTGNHHMKMKAEVTITGPDGQAFDTVYVSTGPAVLPGMSLQLKAPFVPPGDLPLGTYGMKSKVMLEDGSPLAEQSGKFEIAAPYQPPLPDASLSLIPTRAAQLSSPDGRVKLDFPAGAAVEDARVILRGYSSRQLPDAPSGYSLAETCFRVDGLSGLLARPGTVTVKYSPADLEKAAGAPARLKVARWDKAANRWEILRTRVDEPAMSLAAHTDRMGLFVVLVSPPAKPVNWSLIAPAIAGSALALFAAAMLVLGRKRRPAT